MTAISNIINYFHDCYQSDNRGTIVLNIFHKKIENRIFLEEKEELLTGFLSCLPLETPDALDAKKRAYLYRKEKRLVYCSIFVVGRIRNSEGKLRKICSPLFFYPAKIEEDNDIALLSVDLTQRQINYGLLSTLTKDNDTVAAFYETLFYEMPEGALKFGQMSTLEEIFCQFFPEIETENVYAYPQLTSEKALKKAFDNDEENLTLFPAAVIALIPKSREARGVLTELTEIANSDAISTPLNIFFDPEQDSAPIPKSIGRVPVVLSNAQEKILKSAAVNPLTLVIGPPGTGKSFTIASMAVEHLSRGESVLIASKMNHAVDVVATKIENQLNIKDCLVRGGRRHYLRELKTFLNNLLHGIMPNQELADENLNHLNRRLKRLDKTIETLEKAFEKRRRWELKWGNFLVESNLVPGFSLLRILKEKYLRFHVNRRLPLSSLIEKLEAALNERERLVATLIRVINRERIQQTLNTHRSDLQTFLKAIRARTGGKQERLFRKVDFSVLLNTFPIWLVNLSAIYDVLPLKSELFDLAIIDEATQCDIASCIPIFQRAKRVVIVGDPKQLRHISFLSRSRQEFLAEKYTLSAEEKSKYNYRDKSILDLIDEVIATQEKVIFLDEHYRSVPQIINFSNTEFYNNSLRIMTEKPDAFREKRIHWKFCHGHRSENGRNPVEAKRLMDDVLDLVEQERHLDKQMCHSVGILSPFRDQVDYIFEMLNNALSMAIMDKHDILAGTAYTFQGEERDFMYLSFAIDSDYHPSTLYYLNKPDIFNVSITRGRSAQYVYTSIKPDAIPSNTLFRKYLEQVEMHEAPTPTAMLPIKDIFMKEVTAKLQALGFRCWRAYTVAGMKIDIVIERSGKTIGIDLIGYPGKFERSFSLERYKMFHRAGLMIFPLTYSFWKLKREACLAEIKRLMLR